ncbi:DNA alkylation repair protein [Halobacteriovorax sp. HLS]|uniref:DNA alkylation repair protein n=1 Tax=Halobacteriovorax sp. HLS TaxID=2234000 RepID=UPI000FDC621F|nr:DNA alkylation repair protein [Halobacteriovorax sp. HLS]
MKLQEEVRTLRNPERAEKCKRFFKTGKGEYGHGDLFLGISTPILRDFAKKNIQLSIPNVKRLIKSKFHEERLLGLLILVNKYQKAESNEVEQKIFQIYISHFKYINNWDLVDVTCPHIVGKHLMDKDRELLYKWAKSDDLWTRRIAMITNWWFVRKGDLKDVFKISKILLNDEHDLIHKAVGWMLREAAKKDLAKSEAFLKKHYKKMPRTMLRYAIEKFPETKRQKYLKGKIS